MFKRIAPLLVAVTLLAGGCADEPIPDSEKILIESSSSPLGPSQGKEDAPAKDAKPKKKKAKVLVARQAGIRFTAPRGWTPLSANHLDFAADSPRSKEIAERTGLTPDQLKTMLKSVDHFLLGFSGVLTVGALNNSGTLPTRAGFEAQFGTVEHSLGAEEEVRSPLGNGRVFPYELSVGGVEQRGATFYVLNGKTVVEITSADIDQSKARAVLDEVIASLKAA